MEIKRITKTVHTDKGIDLGIPDIELPPSSILQLNNSLNYKNKEANRNVSIEDFNLDNENILNTSSAEEINTDFSTYDLSDEQVKKIARLCVQEQGTVEGAAAEASLMANLFEVNNNGKYDGQKDFTITSETVDGLLMLATTWTMDQAKIKLQIK